MNAFETEMTQHQVEWRKRNVSSKEFGRQNEKEREWILPERLLGRGTLGGNPEGFRPLVPHLEAKEIQKHGGVHNLKSSWVLCANLYFPFGGTAEGMQLLADFFRAHVSSNVQSVDAVELEYAAPGELHPSKLLGEPGGKRGTSQTSPDVAFLVNGGRGLILTENKFVEHSFYRCSGRLTETSVGRLLGNPDPSRCMDATTVLNDPTSNCHLVQWGRRYWEHLAPIADGVNWSTLSCCPAGFAGYQLFRQQALAEGIAKSGKYDFVHSCVAIDERNNTLQSCFSSTGLPSLADWGSLFCGKAKFSTFTHQQWVSWVGTHDPQKTWSGWLCYVRERYGLDSKSPEDDV